MTSRSQSPVDPAGDVIKDWEWLTQLVFGGSPPLCEPRPVDRDGLSMLRGQLDVNEACSFVRRDGLVYEGDRVRHATAGDLRAEGFVVRLSPSKRNPIHVSVAHQADWGVDEAAAFDGCFVNNDQKSGGGPNEGRSRP